MCRLQQPTYVSSSFPLKKEFVDLYTDWILAKSIHKKFKAFKQGFDLVMSQSCLADLVIAEELEIIICGSTVSDEA